jgi:Tol biopolymer transport system component
MAGTIATLLYVFNILLAACALQNNSPVPLQTPPPITQQPTPSQTAIPIKATPLASPTSSLTPLQPTAAATSPLVLNTLTPTPQNTNESEIWYVQYVQENQAKETKAYKEIFAFNSKTRQKKTFVREDGDDYIYEISLSPAGKHIAYTTIYADRTAVKIASLSDSKTQTVVDAFRNVQFVWLADNRLVVMGNNNPNLSPADGEWFVYEPAIKQRRLLTRQGNKPLTCHPSPTGSIYTIIGEESGKSSVLGLGHIEVRNDAASTVIDIPFDPQSLLLAGAVCPSWSLNHEKIVFSSTRPGFPSNSEFYLVTADGKSATRITNLGQDYRFSTIAEYWAVSPDGKWVICAIHLDKPSSPNLISGTNITALISTDGQTIKLIGKISSRGRYVWSPDSRYIAVGLQIDKTTEIYQLNVETQEMIRLTSDGGWKEVFDWR